MWGGGGSCKRTKHAIHKKKGQKFLKTKQKTSKIHKIIHNLATAMMEGECLSMYIQTQHMSNSRLYHPQKKVCAHKYLMSRNIT